MSSFLYEILLFFKLFSSFSFSFSLSEDNTNESFIFFPFKVFDFAKKFF